MDTGERICVIHPHKPFFYAKVQDIDVQKLAEKLTDFQIESKYQLEAAKITGWEEVEKELQGKKEKFWKIYTNYPKAVPPISKELNLLGIECYEKDILFIHRYLRDNKITPMTLVKAEGEFSKETKLRVPIFKAEKIEQISLESISKVTSSPH